MHHLYWIIPVVVFIACGLAFWYTRDRRGLTECLWDNDIEAVKTLLAANPSWVNDLLPDDDGFLPNCPPIFYVRSIEMFDLFLELGADPTRLGRFYSLDNPDPAITRALTSVCFHCDKGALPIVQKLVAMGADVNERSGPGFTPLLICAANGQLEVARFLLEHHADPNLMTEVGHTALLRAVEFSGPEMVQLLLDHGADPELSTPSAMDVAFINVAKFPISVREKQILEAIRSKSPKGAEAGAGP